MTHCDAVGGKRSDTEYAIVHHGRLNADVEVLAKPYSKADLAVKIREILDRL